MEDRRRQRVAFENVGKEMLRYLENSEELKVGITELQEQLWYSWRGMKGNQKVFEILWQEEEESCPASWARWDAQWKGLVELERRCQDTSRETQTLNKRQEIFSNAIDGRPRVQGPR